VPHLIPLLESRDTDVRFYATFLFSELKFPETLEALSDRLFDRDRQVRAIAVDVIRGYRPHPEYHLAVKKVIDLLEMPSRDMEAKQIAAVVLGELGEPVAISVLVKMLGSVDAKLLKNSHQALIRICFQDFGYSEKIWFIWYDENRERHRLEWAMDGLTGASEETRRLALQELKRTLSESAPVDAEPGNMLEYRALQEALRAWWEETGRDIHHYKKDD
jgi:HEAT repeat protein